MPHLAHRYEGLGFKGQGSGFIFLSSAVHLQFEVYDAPQTERAMPRRLAAHLQIMADQGAERSLFSSCPECALHSAPSTWTDAVCEHAWRSPGPTPWWGPTFQVTTDENLFRLSNVTEARPVSDMLAYAGCADLTQPPSHWWSPTESFALLSIARVLHRHLSPPTIGPHRCREVGERVGAPAWG
jgi:hypothetical protein